MESTSSEKEVGAAATASSYTYWVREVREDAAPLPLPKKLDPHDLSNHSQHPPSHLGSVWNRAGTWEEKNLNKWASDRIKELLISVGSLEFSGGRAEITEVSKCVGDRNKNVFATGDDDDVFVHMDYSKAKVGVDEVVEKGAADSVFDSGDLEESGEEESDQDYLGSSSDYADEDDEPGLCNGKGKEKVSGIGSVDGMRKGEMGKVGLKSCRQKLPEVVFLRQSGVDGEGDDRVRFKRRLGRARRDGKEEESEGPKSIAERARLRTRCGDKEKIGRFRCPIILNDEDEENVTRPCSKGTWAEQIRCTADNVAVADEANDVAAFLVTVRNKKRVSYTYELTLRVKGEWLAGEEKKKVKGYVDIPEFSVGELDDLQFEVKLNEEKDLTHQDKLKISQDLKLFLQPVREKLLQFEQELRDR
ncbi:hypothetical protein RHGRI_000853 [Rhododendron griersonianum]|uniref:Activator of Hsp90 ATPase AHSA1-like N-terminal domain-containing protein n=1 Tax=Rhododendron griersonianum TaxID=479676 RepID=A0AAV6LJ23_9ERIC|nr:hypothetical protein RHGRI_000853 [Rhododendron griersonianum]